MIPSYEIAQEYEITVGNSTYKVKMDKTLYDILENSRILFDIHRKIPTPPVVFIKHIINLGGPLTENNIETVFWNGLDKRLMYDDLKRKMSNDKEDFDKRIKKDPYFKSMQKN